MVDLSEMNPMEYSGVVFLSFCQDFEVIRASLADWCELKKFISFEQNDLDRPRSTCTCSLFIHCSITSVYFVSLCVQWYFVIPMCSRRLFTSFMYILPSVELSHCFRIKMFLLRTVPSEYKGFWARSRPHEKINLCKGYWNP